MSKRVLVVDDSLLMRRMIADTLVDGGWEVVAEAADGQEAVQKFAEFRPEAVTMDIVMPGTSGLVALEGILKLDPSAKVVVISAAEPDQNDLRGDSQGRPRFSR